jgi:hypothetical protein
MKFPKSAVFVGVLVCAILVTGVLAETRAEGELLPDIPDPDMCIVDPWDQFFFDQIFVSPGSSHYDDVHILIRNESGEPIPDIFVTIDLSSCENLCIDYPVDGLSGTTDVNGLLSLNPRVGGCEPCTIELRAGGVVIRSYSAVSSTDWNGYEADGHVTLGDYAFFATSFASGEPCADYNGDGQVSISDFIIFGASYMNDFNDYPCYGQPETGVCCFGEICEIISEESCTQWGGAWMDQETCADNPCRAPVLGACCFPPPFEGPCQLLYELECYQSFGIWDGHDVCDPDPCPDDLEQGAACPTPGLDEFEDTFAAFMVDVPDYFGPRPIIARGPTTVLRRYRQIDPEGPCVIETKMLELELDGVYNPNCKEPQHERAVHVRLDGSIPTMGTIETESDVEGNPDFPAESFFDVHVVVEVEGLGAFPHTVMGMQNILYDNNLWDYHPCVDPDDGYTPPSQEHLHVPCPDVLPTGCCRVGSSEFYTNEGTCVALGGQYLGDGSTCPGCGIQACCYIDQSCVLLAPVECVASGGYPWGGAPDCDPNPCPAADVADGPINWFEIGEVTPNPSYGSVGLSYRLETAAPVQIDLYDADGRLVRRFPISQKEVGQHEFVWDGKDDDGRELPAGVYFLAMRAGNKKTTKGIVLLR